MGIPKGETRKLRGDFGQMGQVGTRGERTVMELRLTDECASIIQYIASGFNVSRDGKFFLWDVKLVAWILLPRILGNLQRFLELVLGKAFKIVCHTWKESHLM